MSKKHRVPLTLLPTGVPGFDEVLGGGLPEYSFNLITGTSGTGKTRLTHQIMFTKASAARPALYFLIDLSEVVLEQGLREVLEQIVRQVEETSPSVVIVDSFQAVVRTATAAETGWMDLQNFVQRLAGRCQVERRHQEVEAAKAVISRGLPRFQELYAAACTPVTSFQTRKRSWRWAWYSRAFIR